MKSTLFHYFYYYYYYCYYDYYVQSGKMEPAPGRFELSKGTEVRLAAGGRARRRFPREGFPMEKSTNHEITKETIKEYITNKQIQKENIKKRQ